MNEIDDNVEIMTPKKFEKLKKDDHGLLLLLCARCNHHFFATINYTRLNDLICPHCNIGSAENQDIMIVRAKEPKETEKEKMDRVAIGDIIKSCPYCDNELGIIISIGNEIDVAFRCADPACQFRHALRPVKLDFLRSPYWFPIYKDLRKLLKK